MGYTKGITWTNELIAEKVKEVIKILNISRMPTSNEVRMLNISGLDGAISRFGGYPKIATKLGLELKKETVCWDEQKVESGILDTMKHLKIDRMPTRSEILNTVNGNPLHCRITKSGGYEYWAKKLGLNVKESESKTGWDAEEIAKISIETSFGYKVEKMSKRHPYDLLVNDFIKVDVKCAKPYILKGSRVHTFGISKKNSTCDLYIIYALDENGKIERTFIIPGHKLNVVTMCIGSKTKYDKYFERWDYFQKYNDFFERLREF